VELSSSALVDWPADGPMRKAQRLAGMGEAAALATECENAKLIPHSMTAPFWLLRANGRYAGVGPGPNFSASTPPCSQPAAVTAWAVDLLSRSPAATRRDRGVRGGIGAVL